MNQRSNSQLMNTQEQQKKDTIMGYLNALS